MFFASVAPPLGCLLPLATLWARWEAQSRQSAREFQITGLGPSGIAILPELARELGWQVRCRCWPDYFNDGDAEWPVGWSKCIDFTVRAPGGGARHVFVQRRVTSPSGTLPDLRELEHALLTARRVLQRCLADPDDLGIAAVEMLLTSPTAVAAEPRWLDLLLDSVMQLKTRVKACASFLHVVRDGSSGSMVQPVLRAKLALLVQHTYPTSSRQSEDCISKSAWEWTEADPADEHPCWRTVK